jgi:integrase
MQATIGNSLLSQIKPKDRAYDVRDVKLTGFIIRVNVSGKLVYMCEYARGKRITIGKVGVLTPTQARDRAKEILASALTGEDPQSAKKKKNPEFTLRTYLNSEYGPWVTADRKSGAKTLRLIQYNFKDYLELPLKEIKPVLIEKWRIDEQKRGKALTTINRDITRLKAALSKAVDWEMLEFSPLVKLKPLKTDNNGKVRYLSPDEEKRLRSALIKREALLKAKRSSANEWRSKREYNLLVDLKHYSFVDHLQPMVLLSINTGIRLGELLSLTWDDINFDRAIFTVKGTNAKSGRSRHIPLNSEAFNVLKDWRAQTESNNYIFANKDGKRFDNIKRSWSNLLQEAGISNFRWHDLRHHFASKLVMAGVDLNTTRELLGHADLTMTLRYAHLAPEHKAQAVARLLTAETK